LAIFDIIKLMRNLRRFKGLVLLILLGLAVILTGCVRRVVTISSSPLGAKVFFGSEEKGCTPISFDFISYGSYPIKLTKDGYEDFCTTELLKAPAYEYIPFERIAEILPVRLERRFEFTYQLESAKEISEE